MSISQPSTAILAMFSRIFYHKQISTSRKEAAGHSLRASCHYDSRCIKWRFSRTINKDYATNKIFLQREWETLDHNAKRKGQVVLAHMGWHVSVASFTRRVVQESHCWLHLSRNEIGIHTSAHQLGCQTQAINQLKGQCFLILFLIDPKMYHPLQQEVKKPRLSIQQIWICGGKPWLSSTVKILRTRRKRHMGRTSQLPQRCQPQGKWISQRR